jgi:hypothetical protein
LPNNVTTFIKTKIKGLIFKNFLIFVPVIFVLAYLTYLEDVDLVSSLFNIAGNIFFINNFLLILISLSFYTIFISILLYTIDLWSDIFRYKGDALKISVLHIFIFILIILLMIGIVMYIGLIIGTVADKIILKADFVNFNGILLINKWITLITFIVFLIADLTIFVTQKIIIKDIEGNKIHFDNDEIKNKTIKKAKNVAKFSLLSIFLINLPMIVVAIYTLIITNHIEMTEAFQFFYDKDLDLTIKMTKENFGLFIGGLETGIIIASILLSQLIFAVLKINWEFEEYIIS